MQETEVCWRPTVCWPAAGNFERAGKLCGTPEGFSILETVHENVDEVNRVLLRVWVEARQDLFDLLELLLQVH